MNKTLSSYVPWLMQAAAIILAAVASSILANQMDYSEQQQSPIWFPAVVGVAVAAWLGQGGYPTRAGYLRRNRQELTPYRKGRKK